MKIEEIFCEVLSISETAIQDSTNLKDIASWDSMTHMILITRLEEVFNVRLSGDEIADMLTMGDARRLLTERGISL